MATMMACGHAANATCSADGKGNVFDPPIPSCAICMCTQTAVLPDTEGRMMRCSYFRTCGTEGPSNPNAAFWSSGERERRLCAVPRCGYSIEAHLPEHPHRVRHEFKPRDAAPFDSFYCGCMGWD